jgi:hypothetical protein
MSTQSIADIMANFKAVQDSLQEPKQKKESDGGWMRVRIGTYLTNCTVQPGGAAYHHGAYGPCNCGISR